MIVPVGWILDSRATAETVPPEFSDEALALRFAERHRDDLRYVAAWGRWLHWTGAVWQFDATLAALDFARAICREAAAECKDHRATTISSKRTISAVVGLARADRRLAATVYQWDADPWLLNTPSGVVDLRTGKLTKADPGLYCTKINAVGPGGLCPNWLAHLEKVMGGDRDLMAFLQRFVVGSILSRLL